MRTTLTILGIAGGVVLLVLLGVAIAVWTVDPNQFIGPIQARIKASTGRDVAIKGGIDLKLGLEPRLVVNDVRIGNAPWAKAPDMVTAKSIELEVALLPLLRRHFELVRLNLVDPVIALETNAAGEGNWELAPPKGGTGAPAGNGSPGALGIGDLAITRGALTYRDGGTGAETHVVIDALSLRARDPQSPVNAEFRGTIDGIAVALTGNLGPLGTLAERRLPYPVAVQGEVAGKKSSIALKVQRSDGLVELQDIDASSGSTKVRGKVGIRQTGKATTYVVNLTSPSMSLDDLALPAAAAPAAKRPSSVGAGTKHLVFDDTPVSFDALHKNNASGEIAIDRLVLSGGRALDKVRVQFTLQGGKLDVPVFQAAGFGGTLAGKLAVDTSRGPSPTIALVLNGHQLDIAALLSAAGIAREVRGGKTELAIDVTMKGDSPHKWMSGINGRARAVVGPATVVNTKLDPTLSFDRIAQLVNPFRAAEPNTELRCAVARLPLSGGVAKIDRSIAVETREIDVGVTGSLDFRNETLDLAIRPRVRQGVSINIAQFAELVRFHGPFTAPTVGVDAMASAATIARIGAAVGTGGLSILGETLLSSASGSGGGGAGACDIALGKAPAPAESGGQGATSGVPNPAGEIGNAVGRLFKK